MLRHILATSRALVVLSAFALTACAVHPVVADRELRQELDGARSIVVSSMNGGVELIHDPSAATMRISALVRCSADTREKAAARVEATRLTAVRDTDGVVRVGVEFTPVDPAVTIDLDGVAGGSRDSANIVIRAASLEDIVVSTTNGSIDVGGFAGTAKLGTTNGSIEIRDHAGTVEARSTNGAIRASGVHAPIAVETSNGRIEVSLAPSAAGDVRLETSNGAVTLELGAAWQGTVTAVTSNGKVELSGGEVLRRPGANAMTVGDPAKAKATIDTSNGRVTVRAARK